MEEADFCDEFLYCQCCAVPQRLRHDIVWFGELPMHIEAIHSAVEKSDLFIVVGSSGHVYPAADLVNIANVAGATTILVNLEAPLNAENFDEVHLGKAGELLPNILEALS